MIIVVDSNEKELRDTVRVLQKVYPAHDIETFTHPLLSVKFAANNPVRAVFLSADMPMLGGSEATDLMRRFHGGVSVFFIGNGEAGTRRLHAEGADGYLLKPLSEQAVAAICGDL